MTYFGHRVLFAEDMVMYFMKRFRGKWAPGFFGKTYNEYPRHFTEAMGSVAWYLAHSKIEATERVFYLEMCYTPKFSEGYNPEDFLHYCGVVGYMSALESKYGELKPADETVRAIITYLGEITRDGSFDARGGWETLERYARVELNKIEFASFAERILFAEDLVKYFMTRAGVEWTPGTDGKHWSLHRRRFTEAIGSATWFFATTLPKSYRFFICYNRHKDSKTYRPRDFLQYCGIMAWSSIYRFKNGDAKFPDLVVLDIMAYLGEFYQDDSFPERQGWYGLQTYAHHIQDILLRQTNAAQEMQQADSTLMEKQCIGSLLQDT